MEFVCPCCKEGHLQYRDHCPRISRAKGGDATWYWIPRCQCDSERCRKVHRMLPEFMVKFKQYRTEVITSALDQKKGFVGDDAYNEHPSVKTIQHWHHWLMANYLRIDGTLRSVGCKDLGFSEKLLESGDSLLIRLRASDQKWLAAVHRFVYNSGGWLETG